jgi:hypothetical protein
MVYFNLVMVNLNGEYDPYDPGAGQLPNQAEWDEIFAICGKQHAQYWNDPAIKQPPLAADATGVFKLAPIEEMLALTVGPQKIVEGWFEACKAHMVPRAGPEALEAAMPCFDVAEYWKGDSGAKLYHKAMARLTKAPMSLVHGDVNPGNIWKTTLGKTGDEKFCFADWQLLRMGPVAWEFTTPQIGIYPGLASLLESMKTYHSNLCKLKPDIAAEYPYETFEMHVKCATVAFWQFIFAFVHASAIVPTNTGEMDADKADYTWSKFMPGCFAMMAGAMKELEMEQFCKDLLAADA